MLIQVCKFHIPFLHCALNRVFFKLDEIGNQYWNQSLYYVKTKIPITKYFPQWVRVYPHRASAAVSGEASERSNWNALQRFKMGGLIFKHHYAFQWDLLDAPPDAAAVADTRCGYPLMNPRPLFNLWFRVQHSPFLASLACATQEIFKLLFLHHLIVGLWLESVEHDYIRSLKFQSYK